MTLLTILTLGFVLGVRHATDADHVVAVTTIISRERSLRGAMLIGALWGMGHTATLLAVGGSIVLFGLIIPPRLGLSMEMSVAAMLVILGAMNLSGALRRIDDATHGAYPHVHRLIPSRRNSNAALRPIAVGVVHGLAGSAAVALLVIATIREPAWALLYLAVFGTGTVLGMVMLTAAMIMPLKAIAQRFGSIDHTVARITGVASIVFGLFLAYHIGIVDGLFTSTPAWTPR